MYCSSRRVAGRVHPEVFFRTQCLEREKGVGEHRERRVMMPAGPGPSLIVSEAEFFLELMVVLLDRPAALRQAHQSAQRVSGREMAQEVLGRLLLFGGPLD